MGSKLVETIALIVLALAQALQFWLRRRDRRGPQGYIYNPNPPGKAETCIRHGEEIAKLGVKVEDLMGHIKEIKAKVGA